MTFFDLQTYVSHLEKNGKLKRIKIPVNKDWEISAVTRRLFQKIDPKRRPALLFENITDYRHSVLVGALGASREIYAMSLGIKEEEIFSCWSRAQKFPIDPVLVESGPCQEIILEGEEADLTKLPIPIWTVNHDPSPYITAGSVISKDPETGVRNVGTYRVQVKGPHQAGLFVYYSHHMFEHVRKNEINGQATPVAIVIGGPPVVGLCSVSSLPRGVDELAVSGGLLQQPIELVKCKSIDLEVPAAADFVIEGLVRANYREQEGPFGEYTGYIGPEGNNLFIDIQCITSRRDAIFQAYISEMPPSESSCIRGIGHEVSLYQFLKETLGMPIHDVHFTEGSGSEAIVLVSMNKTHPAQPREVAWATWGFDGSFGKKVMVVDADIDIRDHNAVDWAFSFCVQPARDIVIEDRARSVLLDPSLTGDNLSQEEKSLLFSSKIFIDATKKHKYPSLALPPKEHLEEVERKWKEYGMSDI